MSSSSIATKNAIASSSSTVNRTRTGRRWFPVSCNKCHKAMDSTVFVCSCKCLFCEDCTYSYFQSSSNCPGCGRLLGENDFTEIMISDTSSKFATNPDEILQSMLTKTSTKPGAPITWNDMCAAVMQEQDAVLTNTKVFMKQFVRETTRSLQEGRIAKNQVQAYQNQLMTLKKDISGLKTQHQEYTQRMHEKDRQIEQLKNMLLSRTSSRETRSRHGGSRHGGSRHGERGWQSGSELVPTTIGVLTPSTQTSVLRRQKSAGSVGFQKYVRKKEKGEIDQERNLMSLARRKNPMMHSSR